MQPCPRQVEEATMQVQIEHKSHWRDDGTCSYCGSIRPGTLFKAIEDGCQITPTDKSYKIYVDLPEPNPAELRVSAGANFDQSGQPGWKRIGDLTDDERAMVKRDGMGGRPDSDWVMFAPRGPTIHEKFYFQHLAVDERKRFVDLYNAKALKLAAPGYFYTLPFFMRPAG